VLYALTIGPLVQLFLPMFTIRAQEPAPVAGRPTTVVVTTAASRLR